MIRFALFALVLSGCATARPDPALAAYPDSDAASVHAEEGVRRMQDEFNTLFPDG